MTITFDYFSIAISVFLLLLALISPWFSSMARRPRIKMADDIQNASENDVDESTCNSDSTETTEVHTPTGATSALPFVSIVLAVHDNACELEERLPQLLEQQYRGKWEVIIVDESSTDDTQDVLTRAKAKYPRLYTTFIPESSHYISRRKLSLTMAVKASKGDWILITDIDCKPTGNRWLATMAEHATDDKDLIMGYTSYDADTPAYWRYDRLNTLCYQLHRIKNGIAYRNIGCNLMFRKSDFIQQKGFLHNLVHLRGEYDFIVNEMATPDRTAFVYDFQAQLCQRCPADKTWLYDHLYYLESRTLMKRGLRHRLLCNTDQWMLHLGWLLPMAALAYAISASNLVVTVAATIALLLTLVTRLTIFLSTCRQFDEHISWWKAPWLEVRTVWQNAWLMWRHRRADRFDFIRK